MNRTEALDYIREHSNRLIPAAEAKNLAEAFGTSLSTLKISSELMPAMTIEVAVGLEKVAYFFVAESACALAGVSFDDDKDAAEVKARSLRAVELPAKHGPSCGRSIPIEQ